MATTSLIPNPKNTRNHSPEQIERLGASISTFGFIIPITVDAKRRIIAGHGRWLAAKARGLREVPVIFVEHLSEAQLQAFAIADNRLTDLSDWDDDILAQQLKELSALELEFDIEVIGFPEPEIDIRIQSFEDSASTASDSADDLPNVSGYPPVSRRSDIWHY